MYIDSHCHLDFPELAQNLPRLLDAMAQNQVTHALCVAVNLDDWPRVRDLAHAHAHLFASAGVHPDYELLHEPDVAALCRMAADPRVVAIGETGLDYFRLKGDLEWQRERFRTHIRAARECGRPLIIHTRAAAEDTLAIMTEERADEVGGVMHCFTESWEVARRAMDLGFYISFSGIVTFKNAAALREVVAQVPLEQMLIETDSPYLAPVPHRGKTNEPSFVAHVAAQIALVKQCPVEAVGRITSANFFRLFRAAAA